METLALPRPTRSGAAKELPPPLPSPVKPPADQIATPEKPIQPPRRQRNRRVALSLSEVKRVAAQGTAITGPTPARSEHDDLALLVPKPARKSPKTKAPVKLIDKYEMLMEFFNCMVGSIQLLRKRGSLPYFVSVCGSIQNLTQRKFSYTHLAQLQHIFSEAIVINKVSVKDEVTCCMKPELQISLQVEAVREDMRRKGETGYTALMRVFKERLVDFSNKHPQGDDVPEETLPHPFNQTKEVIPQKLETIPIQLVPAETPPIPSSHAQFAGPSHMSQSFKPYFSRRKDPSEQKTSLLCLDQATSKEARPISLTSPIKTVSTSLIGRKSPLGLPTALLSPSKLETPDKTTKKVTRAEKPSLEELSNKEGTPAKKSSVEELSNKEGTPAKYVSTPTRLMTRTPEIQTPKRSRLDAGCDSPRPVKSEKRSTRTKLFSTPKKNEKTGDDVSDLACSSFDDDYDDDADLSLLPKQLLQSIKEKERKALEERAAGVDEAKKRRQSLSRLPNMFDTILLIVQSTQRSTMTKQELIHKIITSNLKIVDKDEAEEQLKLLQELVPDYIFEKVALSGDTLCCVNKMSCPEEVRRRLAEAV